MPRLGVYCALSALPAVVVDARTYSSHHDPNDEDLPGHSDQYQVTAPSGLGCQVADWEAIPWRNPDRSGTDDGSLWTGETTVHISRYTAEQNEGPKTVCNGTFYLPTVLWIGPYLQGENGTGNNFALGMVAFETNSTDKSDVWHAYRPCTQDYLDEEPPADVWFPYDSALEFKAGVHYSDSSPGDNTTIGLRLTPTSPGAVSFNGTFNDVKESEEYYGMGESGLYFFSFSSKTDLNCTRVAEGTDNWPPPNGAVAQIQPGSPVNGTLSNNTVSLHISSTDTYRLVQGIESPEPVVTNVGDGRTDIQVSFSGRFDSRNSSQSLVINTTGDTVITFSLGYRQFPSTSLLSAVLGLAVLCVFL
ncbi:uncharacterized protein BJX67DRAFT_192393 [Aspergillus lucknowensis]|uniref:Uncharacterized protein n=1 Tax=Aspergillus lucknowensis TaxID=176173 RepID=A0ABR4LKI8_9EURO